MFWVDAVSLPSEGLVYQIVPAIFLLASVLTFSTLTKYNEITAMRSGDAPLRLARPIFLLGERGVLLLVSLGVFLPLCQSCVPSFLWHTRIRRETVAMPRCVAGTYLVSNGVTAVSVELGLPQKHCLLGVTIYAWTRPGPSGSVMM